MTRSARATFLILALLWQAVVWLTPWGQAQRVADLSNTMVHAQALAHHHHSDHHHDHALHMDDHVTDAAQHQHASETLQWVALVPPLQGFALDQRRPLWPSNLATRLAAVFLQGPLRPPQTTAA
jgi:ABC-type Zn2+ transport system substrate-binding protein/surface adhesin